MTTQVARHRVRRDTDANWATANPTLGVGELVHARTSGHLKIGDGATAYNALSNYGVALWQPLDATLNSLAALNGTAGLLMQTAADTFTKRSLASASIIAITNADGAAGPPTISTSMNTGKLLGRNTAGVGTVEELSLGTALSMTGTTLNVASASETVVGAAEIATQAEVDTGTDDSRFVTALKATAKFLAKAGGIMTGILDMAGYALKAAKLQDIRYTRVDKGNSASGTVTFDVSAANWQKVTVTGSPTFAFSNWPADGACILLEVVNGLSGTITWPTIAFVTATGATQATPNRTLQASGTDFVQLWRNGTTVYGKVI